MQPSSHIPVLLEEVVKGLNLHPGDNVIDGTVGGGGHAQAILEATGPDGKLLAIDWDPDALQKAKTKLKKYQPKADQPLAGKNRVIYKLGNYADIKKFAYESGLVNINGILLDLGLSSDQLEDKERGFSFSGKGSLDMRFSPDTSMTAGEIVNRWPKEKLIQIFKEYGEERRAARVANILTAARQRAPIASVAELAELAGRGVGKRGRDGLHPATRIFQALRIAVNDELENLRKFLPEAVDLLETGGRLGIISFHSLEDRIVKQFFRQEARGCICPPQFPTCICGRRPTLRLFNKKPIAPTAEEIAKNRRCRSAKLRIVERI